LNLFRNSQCCLPTKVLHLSCRYLDHHSISEEDDEEKEGYSNRENESDSDTSSERISDEDEKSADATAPVSKRTKVDTWSDED